MLVHTITQSFKINKTFPFTFFSGGGRSAGVEQWKETMSSGTLEAVELFEDLWRQLRECHQNALQGNWPIMMKYMYSMHMESWFPWRSAKIKLKCDLFLFPIVFLTVYNMYLLLFFRAGGKSEQIEEGARFVSRLCCLFNVARVKIRIILWVNPFHLFSPETLRNLKCFIIVLSSWRSRTKRCRKPSVCWKKGNLLLHKGALFIKTWHCVTKPPCFQAPYPRVWSLCHLGGGAEIPPWTEIPTRH